MARRYDICSTDALMSDADESTLFSPLDDGSSEECIARMQLLTLPLLLARINC